MYASNEFNLAEPLKAIVGLRVEQYQQFYTGLNQDGLALDEEQVLDDLDFFPSVNLIYAITDQKNLGSLTPKLSRGRRSKRLLMRRYLIRSRAAPSSVGSQTILIRSQAKFFGTEICRLPKLTILICVGKPSSRKDRPFPSVLSINHFIVPLRSFSLSLRQITFSREMLAMERQWV